jgi:hypothetical protein
MPHDQITNQKNLEEFFIKNSNIISASVLTALLFVFFLIIGFPQFFSGVGGFSQKWFSISVIGIYIVLSYLLCFLQKWDFAKLMSIWVQSNIFFLFAVTYFIRLNNSALNFSTFEISTDLVFIPLSIVFFIVHKNFFQENKTAVGFLIGQVVLISLCMFSLVYYIEVDNSSQRAYSNDFLLQLFKLPMYTWLTVGTFSISAISTLALKLKSRLNAFAIFGFFALALIEVELMLNSMNLGYWAKTLVLITVWDFLFNAILSFLRAPEYDKYRMSIIVSTIYHIFLLTCIFIFNYIGR